MPSRKVKQSERKGFTIIEVVLVLAIAGLIFLMVFIALPALQRSQRDTQRRNDYSMLSSAVSSYSANNGGKLTRLTDSSACRTLTASEFINTAGDSGEAVDPNGKAYVLKGCTVAQWNEQTPGEGEVYIVIKADCNGSDTAGRARPSANSSSRAFAVYGYLESGTYCSASQ